MEPSLPKWFEFPPYVPLILILPDGALEGVKLTEHSAEVPLPERVHVTELKVPAPAVFAKVTVPAGVAVKPFVSLTFAVQVEADPTATVTGAHVTDVVVVVTNWITLLLKSSPIQMFPSGPMATPAGPFNPL